MSGIVEQARTCPIVDINPMDPENLKCPMVMNNRFRAEAPVHQDPHSGIFFVSRYDDVVKMSMDHKAFSSRMLGGNQRAVTDSENS